jgi:two-component system, NarL family, sensor kinase
MSAATFRPHRLGKDSPTTGPAWMTVSDGSPDPSTEPVQISRKRVLTSIILGALAVLTLVTVSGSLAASRLAQKTAVHDAAKYAGLIAETIITPALTDTLASGDPHAFAKMDAVVRKHVIGKSSVRVKIWTPQGRVVYSDEPSLVGKRFELDKEQRELFTHPVTRAEVTELGRTENTFERDQGRLLEVYRPVWTPRGDPLMFETYTSYKGVDARAHELWRGFAGITVSSLLALIVLMVPIVWRLLGKVRQSQKQREALLQRAVDASTQERARIAGTLHDGVVQDLTGASFVVSSAANRAAAIGEVELAAQARGAATTVRAGITGLRSLLVDIYPPSLERSGLLVALEDLTSGPRSRNIEVVMELDEGAVRNLNADDERLIYRIAHECLLNVTRHAQATHVTVSLHHDHKATLLEISDDGLGFNPAEAYEKPKDGHFGLRVLSDVARDAGAQLLLSSAPGHGTRWLLRVPTA